MIFGTTTEAPRSDLMVYDQIKVRRAAQDVRPTIFTDVYNEDTNIVVWRRNLSEIIQRSVSDFLAVNPTYERNLTVTAESAFSSISNMLGADSRPELSEDMAELVEMFCYLFDLKRAGLRLTVLDRAMCPRFHVDNVPCRLVTTYRGIATEWLPHQFVNRKKLGMGNDGLPDDRSGLFENQSDIQQLTCGDVALLKGELWEGNEDAGLVHRSPALAKNEHRLLLTLDFSI